LAAPLFSRFKGGERLGVPPVLFAKLTSEWVDECQHRFGGKR
jgi:hypothetical protein